ncbi:hypothetical protein ACFOSD_07755 [Salinispirillum marinum]|uniref:DUF3015 domain-containing protein n=2 Tax=Saccharospirillaceae TaxID=255527 RepID=A0ABV8BFF4_9GAMM
MTYSLLTSLQDFHRRLLSMPYRSVQYVSFLVFHTVLLFGVAQAQTPQETYASVANPSISACRVGAPVFKFTELNSPMSRIYWDFMSIDGTQVVPDTLLCHAADIAALRFVHETYDTLEAELATGFGRYSADLLNILSCEPAAQREILSAVRRDFAPIMLADDYAELPAANKSAQLFSVVLRQISEPFSAQCEYS